MSKEMRDSKVILEVGCKRLEIQFKADIEENNIWLAASLAYFFSVVYVILTAQVELYVGGVLVLTGLLFIYHFHVQRVKIKQAANMAFLERELE
jgi:hypothetical protein